MDLYISGQCGVFRIWAASASFHGDAALVGGNEAIDVRSVYVPERFFDDPFISCFVQEVFEAELAGGAIHHIRRRSK